MDQETGRTSSRFYPAQTFTVGVAGELSRVELGVYQSFTEITQPLTIDIVATQGGVPLFTAADRLATRTINAIDVPRLTGAANILTPVFTLNIDFSADHLHVEPLDVLAIVLRADPPESNSYKWWQTNQGVNQYTRGNAFSYNRIANSPASHAGPDAHFRTFVVQIPEPAGCALFALGIFTLCGQRRRGHGHWAEN